MNTINKTETVSCVNWDTHPEWERWTGSNTCPNCLGSNIEYNTQLVLTSNPPQSQLRCKDCGHHFSSGFSAEWTNNDALNKLWDHDQSILGKPQVGDWPPSPQVGDWPPTPTPQDPIYIPHSPDTHNYGWICPKCGRSLAPHIDSCPFCNEATPINIIY